MTSSDDTVLDPAAMGRVAAQVGESHQGSADALGRADIRLALVCAKFNGGVTERLIDGVLEALRGAGVKSDAVELAWVPGAFELPLAAQRFAASDRVDAVVALGAVIRGETPHFDFVAGQCAEGLQRVALDTGVPVVFGVLTTDTVDQAMERCAPGLTNKGYEAAQTALEMIDLLSMLPAAPR